MTKFYAREDGTYIGGFDGVEPPAGAIEVPSAPADARQMYDFAASVWLPGPAPVAILYPVDLWSRMTDDEADQVETAMASQPVRVQNIFKYASSYRSDHELWPLLVTIATTLFPAERAAEILAPSETVPG